ncbi:hypothetical protein [Caulobacter sp. 17J80-11]|uniref:hypothetical protein n=1 Tax=Caulobacter sp. 17J80-11 TaxID=2763502 RepID=UPI0016539CAA|nr:hypothetical protein [Caulobacter sp. 17J80-11]MBC6981926.1 hypothetical protein [Caulobacter sp. 17J80-11]
MVAPVVVRLDGVVVVAVPVSDGSAGVVCVIIRLDGVVVDDSGVVERVVALGDVAVPVVPVVVRPDWVGDGVWP